MTFIELLTHLEERLGYHQFPVNARATELAQVFDSSATHHDFVVRLVHEWYKANHCQQLKSPVEQSKVEDVLARNRAAIIDGNKTDIDLFHFIEDVCVATHDFFSSDTGNSPAARIGAS